MTEGAPGSGSTAPALVNGRERWLALGSLVLLATFMSEFLTGSTPVHVLFFYPSGFATMAFLAGLYGAGALVVREVAVRWNKRWASVLLLGAAYALVEEGYAAKTMIDPTASNIGATQAYSYWLGINWTPLVGFTLIEGAFSITLTILLVELLFPATRGKRLVGNAGLSIAIVVFAGVATLISHSEPFIPSIPVAVFLGGLGLAYVLAAYRVPRDLLLSRCERPDRPGWAFFLVGVAFQFGAITLFGLGPHLFPAAFTVGLYGGLATVCLYFLVLHAGRTHNEVPKVYVALGMAAVFVPVDIANEISGDVGVLAFTAILLGVVLYLRRKWTRERASYLALAAHVGTGPSGVLSR